MKNEYDRLSSFLDGVFTARQLLARASQNGSFIESTCLLASIIDAQLRIGIILKHQIETESSEIPKDLLFQKPKGKKFTEREIYKKALHSGTLDNDLFDELSSLYDERNKIIHRYIISDILTNHVLQIAIRYEKVEEKVRQVIHDIESEQIRLGVGMTVEGPDPSDEEHRELFRESALRKHGQEWLAQALDTSRS